MICVVGGFPVSANDSSANTDRQTCQNLLSHCYIMWSTIFAWSSKSYNIWIERLIETSTFLSKFRVKFKDSFSWVIISSLLQIYDVPMKFARKLIHGGPVHPCYEPVKALHQSMVLGHWKKEERNKERNKETRWKLKGRALHWPHYHQNFAWIPRKGVTPK